MKVSFGDCLFDSETRGLWRGGEPVHLSPKAFRLLEKLIEQRPRAVAQKELYDELWPDTFVDLANLHNLVSQVRAAVGDGDHAVIRTVYGFGFSFSADARDVVETRSLSTFALLVADAMIPLRVGTNTVGRSARSDVTILHPSVSRRHGLLVVTPDGVSVEDGRSRNGTYLNGEKLTAPARATARDAIRFGSVEARLVTEEVDTESLVVPCAASSST